MHYWNYIILTAANSRQANAFLARLQKKQRRGTIDPRTVCLAIADGEQSAGSGTAILRTLQTLCARSGNHRFPENSRILCILCGGESRRIPQYAICGKVFAPSVLVEGKDTFDDLLNASSALLSQLDSGILICAGDIPVFFDVPAKPITKNTAFSIRASIQSGTQHGVFLCSSDMKVLRTLQKYNAQTLRMCGAIGSDNLVCLDTGAVFLRTACATRLLHFISGAPDTIRQCAQQKLNFYTDILGAMTTEIESIFDGSESSASARLHKALREALFGESIFVQMLSSTRFIHIGTTAELLQLHRKPNGFCATNSLINPQAVVGNGSYIENSIVGSRAIIGNNCVVSCAVIDNVVVPDNTAIHCIRLADGTYIARIYPVEYSKNEAEMNELPVRFPVANSRAQAVRISLSRGIRNHKVPSQMHLADYDEPADWEESLQNRIRRLSYADKIQATLQLGLQNIGTEIHLTEGKVEERLPVRVNFAGTWTDALPYCTQFGGSVLNAAIMINHTLPVFARVRAIPEKEIKMICIDRNMQTSVSDLSALTDLDDTFDSYLIHKAALAVAGLIPVESSPSVTLPNVLARIGGGLELTIGAQGIPHGSGLGTSSLLLCALIRALYRITGREANKQELIEKTFCAEQLMHCGGGWQDQVGGLTPGFKWAHSKPGVKQHVECETLLCPTAFLLYLRDHAYLIYTGERHFGKNILSDIMQRVTYKDKQTLQTLHEIKQLADNGKHAVIDANIPFFIEILRAHFFLEQKLSDQIVTDRMRQIAQLCGDLLDAISVCGAGGGGFLFVLLKHAESIHALRDRLFSKYGDKVFVAPCTWYFDDPAHSASESSIKRL